MALKNIFREYPADNHEKNAHHVHSLYPYSKT